MSAMSPFNAQATLWPAQKALWGLLLPVTVHGRVSDIWRSYFVSRLFQELGFHVTFSKALVFQDRNPHNFLADFNSELPLYERSGALIEFLAKIQFPMDGPFQQQILQLWNEMYQYGILEESDVQIMNMWIQTLEQSEYIFPAGGHGNTKGHTTQEAVRHMEYVTLDQYDYLFTKYKHEKCKDLDRILFVVKTCGHLHPRATILKNTWGRFAKHLMFLSDVENEELPTILPLSHDASETEWMHQQKDGNTKSCLTTLHGLKLMVYPKRTKFDWIAVGDDDTFWQTHRLASTLARFNPEDAFLFITPLSERVNLPLGFDKQGKPFNKEFQVGSSSAGLVISAGLLKVWKDTMSFENNAIRHICKVAYGDDTAINYIAKLSHVDPTPLEGITYVLPVAPEQQLSFHAQWRLDHIDDVMERHVPKFYEKQSESEVCY